MFDMAKTVELKASVTQFKWKNPLTVILADDEAPGDPSPGETVPGETAGGAEVAVAEGAVDVADAVPGVVVGGPDCRPQPATAKPTRNVAGSSLPNLFITASGERKLVLQLWNRRHVPDPAAREWRRTVVPDNNKADARYVPRALPPCCALSPYCPRAQRARSLSTEDSRPDTATTPSTEPRTVMGTAPPARAYSLGDTPNTVKKSVPKLP